MKAYEPEKSSDCYTEQYIREGILALLPVYNGADDKTLVLTRSGGYRERRSLHWTVRKIAGSYNLDLQAMRKHYNRLLLRRHHISLPFSESLVLLPVKVRRGLMPGEMTNGYVNLSQIAAVRAVTAQELSEISRSLKALARELNIPVVALSQLSRAVEKDRTAAPS